MDITLYYIESISRQDEPYFTTAELQDSFFYAHKVVEISTGFYPPHYENKIKLDIDDVSILTNANYLSLVSPEGKTYYYFINDVKYINEGVLELAVEMDTIQTYMFNVQWHSAIIERKFIERWTDDGKINRDYIRENVSEGDFIHKYHKEFYKSTDFDNGDSIARNVAGIYVFKVTALDTNMFSLEIPRTISRTKNDAIPNIIDIGPDYEGQFSYMIIPVANETALETSVSIRDTRGTWGGTISRYSYGAMNFLAEDSARTVDAYYIPLCPYKLGIDFDSEYGTALALDTNRCTLAVASEYYAINPVGQDGTIAKRKIVPMKYQKEYSLDFTRSQDCSIIFYPRYVPALMDENYIHMNFGEESAYAAYPLYMSTSPDEYELEYWADIDSGTRYYNITSPNIITTSTLQPGFADPLDTMVATKTPLTYDLKNDAYKNWYAFNKYSVATGLAQAGISIAGDVIGAKALYGRKSNLVTKRGRLTKKGKGLAQQAGDSILSDIGGVVGMIGQQENLKASPDTAKQEGEYLGSVLSRSSVISLDLYRVDDYEACAQYYHRNGYLVKEPWQSSVTSSDLLAYVNTRYYYFIAKFVDLDISLNILQTQVELNSIISRYNKGVRYWRVDNDEVIAGFLGNYKYDNIELSSLRRHKI